MIGSWEGLTIGRVRCRLVEVVDDHIAFVRGAGEHARSAWGPLDVIEEAVLRANAHQASSL